MAKLTLTDVTSGYASVDAVNANNAAIEAALENTLSRDGSVPNQMNANIDMNGFSILNQTATTGDTNFTDTGEWTTGMQYLVNNLASVTLADDAVNGGASYICVEAHTAGTFATDLAASKWRLFAARGATGPTGASGSGSGDLIATNNLSDVSDTDAARDNLSAIEDVLTTRGDLLVEGASGPERFAIGVAGKFLVSDGTDLAWSEPTGWEYVGKQTAADTPFLEFTSLDQGGYDHFFTGRNLIPATDSVNFAAQTSPDAGASPTYDTGSTDYSYDVWGRATTSGTSSIGATTDGSNNYMKLTRSTMGSSANEWGNLNLYLESAEVAGRAITHGRLQSFTSAGNLSLDHINGRRKSGVVQAIKFYFTSGNVESGTIYHFKRKLP